jgi:outer membrane lipoprotein LolB
MIAQGGWLLLALLGATAGCALVPPAAPAPAAVERRLAERFELVGRLSVSDGARAASLGLEWRHGASDDWLFLSPLGQVVARIEANGQGATLYTGAPDPVWAASAQELMNRVLGVAPPLDGVEAWVQGVARPGARVRRLDEVGRPASVADAGWIIDYLEYLGPEPDARPRRLEASWSDARLKLVIDQWSTTP